MLCKTAYRAVLYPRVMKRGTQQDVALGPSTGWVAVAFVQGTLDAQLNPLWLSHLEQCQEKHWPQSITNTTAPGTSAPNPELETPQICIAVHGLCSHRPEDGFWGCVLSHCHFLLLCPLYPTNRPFGSERIGVSSFLLCPYSLGTLGPMTTESWFLLRLHRIHTAEPPKASSNPAWCVPPLQQDARASALLHQTLHFSARKSSLESRHNLIWLQNQVLEPMPLSSEESKVPYLFLLPKLLPGTKWTP